MRGKYWKKKNLAGCQGRNRGLCVSPCPHDSAMKGHVVTLATLMTVSQIAPFNLALISVLRNTPHCDHTMTIVYSTTIEWFFEKHAQDSRAFSTVIACRKRSWCFFKFIYLFLS